MNTSRSSIDVAITMRDGTTLRADVHLPDGADDTRFPTVLIRTSYNKGVPHAELDVPAYVDRGFAVVLQDVRGRYRSEGTHYHGQHEREDGFDTLEWIARQPWCNGRVGMTGQSYVAAVQAAAAASGSPHLVSMFHVKAPSSYYLHGARRGGNFANFVLPIEFVFACSSPEAAADPTLETHLRLQFKDVQTWLSRLPFRPGRNPFTPVPDVERFFLDIQEHHEYSDFWRSNVLWAPDEHVADFSPTAALFVGGWYDQFREDRWFSVLRDRPDNDVYLLMGPWGHRDFHHCLGDVNFGASARLSADEYTDLQLSWFDQSLNHSASTGVRPRVTYFRMGGGSGRRTTEGLLDHSGSWHTADDWPLPETTWSNFYFHPQGLLATTPPSSVGNTSTYVHDPADPVPTIGVTSMFVGEVVLNRLAVRVGTEQADYSDLWVPYGPQDQRERHDVFGCTSDLPLWSRRDVLTFETPPLDDDLEVTGPIEVHLWCSSTAVDTDFVVKLIDVYPPNEDYPHGYAVNLSDGVLRASYRHGFERRQLLEPGEIFRLHLTQDLMYPTSNLFTAGHKIRVHIASSDYPAVDVNPGTGAHPAVAGLAHRAQNTIYHDANHPSHIVLPVVGR